jgi:hypothetical protein
LYDLVRMLRKEGGEELGLLWEEKETEASICGGYVGVPLQGVTD